MMTRRDPWVNMLRTTVACFAAGVGGADAVTVQPFDAALGLPDAFARRIARNTQSLLVEEAQPGPGARPGRRLLVRRVAHRRARAGGLGLVHRDRAGRRAWPRRSTPGWSRDRLAAAWERRRPTTSPTAGTRSPASASSRTWPRSCRRAPAAAGRADRRAAASAATPQEFEALRDAARRASGERPTVFLATLGPVAAHTARAAFAANLFQAGGIAHRAAGAAPTRRRSPRRSPRRRRDGRLPLLQPTRSTPSTPSRWPPR